MSAVSKRRLTIQDYFTIERAASFKSEFFDGEMFAMAGASSAHNFIKENLSVELGGQLKGTRCRTLSSDQRIKVEATGLVTYPDIVVVCGKVEVTSDDEDTLNNPTCLIEVLSPSNQDYDRNGKFRNYQQIESLQEYITVAQDEPLCERCVRQPDGTWNVKYYKGLEEILVFTSINARISLADIYNGVAFPHKPLRPIVDLPER
jgi:Uma2 family endonuclease